jgi:hypothetical protein
MKNIFKKALALTGLIGLIVLNAKADNIDIAKYGAKGDGKTVNTKVIQKAIDECSKTSGTVLIPQGRFVTGTIYLKSNVTLFLEKGATLLGSLDSLDYTANSPKTVKCIDTHSRNGKSRLNLSLIYAEDQDNIAIMGEGTIDGQGEKKQYARGDNAHDRPKLIFIISCRNVVIKDVTLTNSAFWMEDYLGCDGLKIQGITVLNHANWNNDGIDIDSRNVTVSDCNIDSDDDGICLKSYLRDKPCENVTITNCVVSSNCDAIKMGTPGAGGFKNIAISNCVVRASKYDNFRHWKATDKYISADASMVNGISVECVDGGNTDGVVIDNITMTGVQTPIFIRVGNRLEKMNGDADKTSTMRNILISNIISDQLSRRTSSITAIPGSYIENVKLNHILFDIKSEGTKDEMKMVVPEKENSYPSPHSFGPSMPASGFFIRHVKNLTLNDVQFNLLNNDMRYALVLDDTHYINMNDIAIKAADGNTKALTSADVKVSGSTDVAIDHKTVN